MHNSSWIYLFDEPDICPDEDMTALLGGKGANLVRMTRLGFPIPAGMILTTALCAHYYTRQKTFPDGLKAQLDTKLRQLEKKTGKNFGSVEQPLLVSVRSGAQVSMPGMMETILNLGLNDQVVDGFARMSGNRRAALDSYRRFIQMYANVVLKVEHEIFEDELARIKSRYGVSQDSELTPGPLEQLIGHYKQAVRTATGADFPQDPGQQLWHAIAAVVESWQIPRAVTYRRIHNIPETWGTAVTIQSMVFGNMGEDSATGVAFTRNPATGARYFYGEYLLNAQGEDVVAGIRTPQPLSERGKREIGTSLPSMEAVMPAIYAALRELGDRLESYYRDVQDIEFTIERGRLYILQTRTAKRTAAAATKIAVDLVNEGIISKETALLRLNPYAIEQLLHPRLDRDSARQLIAQGLPASPGAASGKIAFTADDAVTLAAEGQAAILIRPETSPEDIHGMHAAAGILTTRGGMTSHAAVVARGMGRPCVVGASDLKLDAQGQTLHCHEHVLRPRDQVTIDGSSGEFFLGEVKMIGVEQSPEFLTVMSWAHAVRKVQVRTNAEVPAEVRIAKDFGAQGIGLCRTEHMFFAAERIDAVREMILAVDAQERRDALEKILPMQRTDFEEILKIMAGLPVTIRLLDPPLHEFLPATDDDIEQLALRLRRSTSEVKIRVSKLRESNPMLGQRGCRLLISYPEIVQMQTRAILEAAINVQKKHGIESLCEIMVPLVASAAELIEVRKTIDDTARAVAAETRTTPSYLVGTMIELPRAALQARAIAMHADFFSFGTNDLTQTTWGLSRDDSAPIIRDYQQKQIMTDDPFAVLDKEGVGQLIALATSASKLSKPDIKLGICGEHGGDPASIRFIATLGVDYVSCSPFRLPVACLVLAQAALQNGRPQSG